MEKLTLSMIEKRGDICKGRNNIKSMNKIITMVRQTKYMYMYTVRVENFVQFQDCVYLENFAGM